MPPNRRTIPTVLAEISQLRHHAHEAPPHHGGGRDVLEGRLRALEAELASLRDADRRAADPGAADPGAAVRGVADRRAADPTTTEPAPAATDGSDHDPTEPN